MYFLLALCVPLVTSPPGSKSPGEWTLVTIATGHPPFRTPEASHRMRIWMGSSMRSVAATAQRDLASRIASGRPLQFCPSPSAANWFDVSGRRLLTATMVHVGIARCVGPAGMRTYARQAWKPSNFTTLDEQF